MYVVHSKKVLAFALITTKKEFTLIPKTKKEV